MQTDLYILILTAISVAFLHTVLGPDHYLPFIVMHKAGKWSMTKTIFITVLSGIGHVGSSVLIGLLGIGFGLAIHKIQIIESFRGDIAAWLFTGFGLVYMIWGIRRAVRKVPHTHRHFHIDGSVHNHEHSHFAAHTHVHKLEEKSSLTPWIIFTIFVLGPCEPLIPILMYPAAKNSYFVLAMVTLAFGIVTIATMLGIVILSLYGIEKIQFKRLELYSHALAGGAILLSGLGIIIFDL
jgi:nickel/cobalt transporter (NicO) family protein